MCATFPKYTSLKRTLNLKGGFWPLSNKELLYFIAVIHFTDTWIYNQENPHHSIKKKESLQLDIFQKCPSLISFSDTYNCKMSDITEGRFHWFKHKIDMVLSWREQGNDYYLNAHNNVISHVNLNLKTLQTSVMTTGPMFLYHNK